MICEECFFLWMSIVPVRSDTNLRLSHLEKGAFHPSGRCSIDIASSGEGLPAICFSFRKSLTPIRLDSLSTLQKIEADAYASTSLTDLVIPAAVILFARSALDSVKFIRFARLFCLIFQDDC
jgi:hypothetical protein